jgi:hypothetical protein
MVARCAHPDTCRAEKDTFAALDTAQLLALVLVGLWLVIIAGVVLVLRRRR